MAFGAFLLPLSLFILHLFVCSVDWWCTRLTGWRKQVRDNIQSGGCTTGKRLDSRRRGGKPKKAWKATGRLAPFRGDFLTTHERKIVSYDPTRFCITGLVCLGAARGRLGGFLAKGDVPPPAPCGLSPDQDLKQMYGNDVLDMRSDMRKRDCLSLKILAWRSNQCMRPCL